MLCGPTSLGLLGPPNCDAFGLTAHPGELPISNVGPWDPVLKNSGFGLATGDIRDYSNKYQAYDQISGHDREWTGEVRLATNFDGPFNFLVGGNHSDEPE